MAQFDISFIIVEYYCIEDLRNCIISIEEKCAEISHEIIVSSNSVYSSQKKAYLLDEFSGVKWIFNGKNEGFAKAANRGIKESSAKYLLLLNPDTRLIDNRISQMLKYGENNPDIGIIGPKLIDINGNVQDSCRPFITPYMFASRVVDRFSHKINEEILDLTDYNRIQCVDWVSGACMFVRRKGIEKVGLMDERYFLYMEDMDWCRRFWKSGFKVVYWPNMVVRHDASRRSSTSISRRRINKTAWIHFSSYFKYLLKVSLRIGEEETFFKRIFDIFLSAVGIVGSFPLWLLIAFLIWLEDGGPIFHKQERIGKNGQIFQILKFRSMVKDAEKALGPVQAKENDPRVGRVGRALRATAMDELPQLINILKGDMSFVGPRALRPEEVEVRGNPDTKSMKEIPRYRERVAVKPGLTGLAQVHLPTDAPRKKKFRYDLLYRKKQSFWLDLKLIFLSFLITFGGKWESRGKKI
ncbi:MAG: glycosyltransferase [Proteobacteria bacterium]|nr:glycosyltransferase [Pseudomonadota bacterium]